MAIEHLLSHQTNFLLLLLLQMTKNMMLQWGEMPTSVAFIGTGQIMGWGNKAIEIRSISLSFPGLEGKRGCTRSDLIRRERPGIFSPSYAPYLVSFFPQIFGHGSFGRRLHAQASAKAQVSLRAKRQSVFLFG